MVAHNMCASISTYHDCMYDKNEFKLLLLFCSCRAVHENASLRVQLVEVRPALARTLSNPVLRKKIYVQNLAIVTMCMWSSFRGSLLCEVVHIQACDWSIMTMQNQSAKGGLNARSTIER